MLKGFLIKIVAITAIASVPVLQAQVYKCDGPDGTVFSDMPCGDSAEEIAVEGMETETAEAEAETAEAATPVPDTKQSYQNFLGVLNSQKQFKIGEVDRQLAELRESAGGVGFADMPMADQQRISDQIADLEMERETIIAEYDGLIEEMERRIATDDAIASAQEQLPQQ